MTAAVASTCTFMFPGHWLKVRIGDRMKIVRYQQGNQTSYGSVEGETVQPITGDIFGQYQAGSQSIPLKDVRLLAPVQPSKIVAVGLNYKSHLGDRPSATEPGLFLKPPSSIIAQGEPIIMPADAGPVHYEGELVVIIARRARHVSEADALSYVLGYTCGNDVSARAWQRSDLQWFRAKGSDTFSPLGPWIVTDIDDPSQLELTTRLNGEVRQHTTTDMLIHNIPRCISYASTYVTLEPGDVIYSGTPGQTQEMHDGDTVEVEVSRIGTLRNPVKAG